MNRNCYCGFALIMLFGLLQTSCSRNISKYKSGGDSSFINYNEDISSLRPEFVRAVKNSDNTINRPKETTVFELFNPKNSNVSIMSSISEMSLFNKAIEKGSGYRLQVFSGNNRSDYESSKNYILGHFPELEVYESYSQPTYRLKTGDFLNRLDAERYKTEMISRFSSVKVIMDNVNVKRSLRIDCN